MFENKCFLEEYCLLDASLIFSPSNHSVFNQVYCRFFINVIRDMWENQYFLWNICVDSSKLQGKKRDSVLKQLWKICLSTYSCRITTQMSSKISEKCWKILHILRIPSELQHKWASKVLRNATRRKKTAGIYLTWP